MGSITNRYTTLAGIEHPIVQEGLGPFKTPKLAAAVSNAGGLGTVSMPGFPRDLSQGARTLREHIEECASLTEKPFAVNVPVGIDNNGDVLPFTDTYIKAAVEAREADREIARRLTVLTTSAGFPGPYVARIKEAGFIHQHKVGTTAQAVKAQDAGVDAIIAAGFEMGGHAPSKRVHTYVLVPNVTAAVDIPVVLSGGARDGRTLAAALCLGAEAVAMGTRFIAADENSDWHPSYVHALLHAQEGDDIAFTGVYGPCRGLRNKASLRLAEPNSDTDGDPEELLRWKIESMQRAQSEGDVDDGLVLSGQVASAITEIVKISEFIPTMAEEAATVLSQLTAQQTVRR